MCLAAVQSTAEAGQSHRKQSLSMNASYKIQSWRYLVWKPASRPWRFLPCRAIWFRHDFIPENESVDNNRVVLGASGK